MVDPEWLEELRFETMNGGTVTGLAGIGSLNVVLKVTGADSGKYVLRIKKHCLGFHINEIPPEISARPEYDLGRVNQKLKKLVGNVRLDTMTAELDNLYSFVMKILSEYGVPGFLFSNMNPESVDSIPFLLQTPPIRRRLEEFLEWPVDDNDPITRLPRVNGERYPIQLQIPFGDNSSWWPKKVLDGLPPEWNRDLKAGSLFDNPLIVWGAAAMEGFFTDDEMPLVAEYLKKEFGDFAGSSEAITNIGQVDTLANLIAQYLPDASVDRFVMLCAHCSLLFQARNMDGTVVADGFKLLAS